MAFEHLLNQPCPHLENLFSYSRWYHVPSSVFTDSLCKPRGFSGIWKNVFVVVVPFFFFFFRKTLGCTYLPYLHSKLIPLPPHILLVFPHLLPKERESTLLSNSLKNMVILCHIFTTPSPIHSFSKHLFEHILYQVYKGNKDR